MPAPATGLIMNWVAAAGDVSLVGGLVDVWNGRVGGMNLAWSTQGTRPTWDSVKGCVTFQNNLQSALTVDITGKMPTVSSVAMKVSYPSVNAGAYFIAVYDTSYAYGYGISGIDATHLGVLGSTGSISLPAPPTGSPFAFIGIYNGGSSQASVNRQRASGTLGATNSYVHLYLGTDYAANAAQPQSVYEIAVYDHALSAAELSALENYFQPSTGGSQPSVSALIEEPSEGIWQGN